jgi:sugar phosphate isomerase/epimerase
MSTNRRMFLAQMGASLLSAPVMATAFAAEHRIERLGMQLYTVRNDLPNDFDGTLAKIAALGYREVEFAGYFDKPPQAVKEALGRAGLTSPSTHVGFDMLGDAFPKVIETSQSIGHKFIVNPWIDEKLRGEADIWKRAAERFNRAGELSKQAGIQFAYHNHTFEFVPLNGKMPMDLILEECDPALVKIEMDLCWTVAAGQDPLAWFSRYPGRFPLVHVKGLKRVPADPATPIGNILPDVTDVGSSDVVEWPRIFAKSEQAGIQHYFVEHDQPGSSFDSLRVSAEYLKKLRF